jgi:cation:H+ antiporter
MLASLLPADWFVSLNPDHVWGLWLICLASMAMLVFGADKAVQAAAKIAHALNIPTIIIGATIVSLGTTTPEACVSVMAAIRGNGDLALGNSVGSVICDTALIFGLCCCLVRLPADKFILNRHGWLQLGSGVLLTCVLLGLAWAGGGITGVLVPRWIGLIFLVLLVGYMLLSFKWAKQHPELIPDEAHVGEDEPKDHVGKLVLVNGIALAIGLALVVFGSEGMINSVEQLGEYYKLPKDVMAVTVVAFGTSLPELATALAAIRRGHAGLLVGNIIGADILNVLFVVGAAATAKPLTVAPMFFTLHLPVMLVALVLVRVYIFISPRRFSRWHGLPLLGLYAFYITRLILLKQY